MTPMAKPSVNVRETCVGFSVRYLMMLAFSFRAYALILLVRFLICLIMIQLS